MLLEVHAVVQNTNDFDAVGLYDPEEEEMTSTLRMPCNMNGMEAFGDFGSAFCSCDRRAAMQSVERLLKYCLAGARLILAEPASRPIDNALEIGLGSARQSHAPSGTFGAHPRF